MDITKLKQNPNKSSSLWLISLYHLKKCKIIPCSAFHINSQKNSLYILRTDQTHRWCFNKNESITGNDFKSLQMKRWWLIISFTISTYPLVYEKLLSNVQISLSYCHINKLSNFAYMSILSLKDKDNCRFTYAWLCMDSQSRSQDATEMRILWWLMRYSILDNLSAINWE